MTEEMWFGHVQIEKQTLFLQRPNAPKRLGLMAYFLKDFDTPYTRSDPKPQSPNLRAHQSQVNATVSLQCRSNFICPMCETLL